MLHRGPDTAGNATEVHWLIHAHIVDNPDGEVVALDESGRPDFNLLQHFRTEASRIHYFVFDLLVYNERDLTRLSFIERRQILKSALKFGSPRIRIAEYFETSAENFLSAAREQGLEGVVAKRKDSTYQAGQRPDRGSNTACIPAKSWLSEDTCLEHTALIQSSLVITEGRS
jgi:hypothetical protein